MPDRTASTGRSRLLRRLGAAVLGVLVAVVAYLGFGLLTAPGPREAPGWELLAPMPNPRGETASAVVDGRVYVAGGFQGLDFETTATVSVYDAAANKWSDGPPLPAPRNHAAATALDGVLYVSGGAEALGGATDTFWSLAPGGAWEQHPSLPGPRSGHRMVAAGGRLYVIGGVGGPAAGAGMTGRVLIFDPGSNSWSEGAAMSPNRDHLAAVLVGGEIWAIGGRAGGRNHARVDIYDPESDTWHDGPPLPEGTSGAAEAILDGVIYLSGGEDPASGVIVDRHWRLDTAFAEGEAWDALPAPPLAVHGVPGIAVGGRFLIIAGSRRPGAQSNTAWTGATQAFTP